MLLSKNIRRSESLNFWTSRPFEGKQRNQITRNLDGCDESSSSNRRVTVVLHQRVQPHWWLLEKPQLQASKTQNVWLNDHKTSGRPSDFLLVQHSVRTQNVKCQSIFPIDQHFWQISTREPPFLTNTSAAVNAVMVKEFVNKRIWNENV